MTPLESVTPIAATGVFSLAWLLIVIPLTTAAILLLTGRVSDKWGHLLATAAPLASFGLGLAMFITQMGEAPDHRVIEQHLYQWFSVGSWEFPVGLLVDPLSIVFVLLITGVGGLIHIYSMGYMAHDPKRRRFFAFLNLFIAAMLTLVLADNYLVLFVGWEGVGLASYLLISFWQERPKAAAAGKKAFVMNRVGDLGMTMAIFSMLAMFGSSQFTVVSEMAHELTPTWATLIGIFLLIGACGKSAQVPLQAWLLDAMEGPTPVSALIHAATMVTAGVYLVVRSHAIFEMSEVASFAVVLVGTVTLLAGAWIGTAKDDIKKVLAGSTMSQIGYMMVAAGIGPAGYAFAIFHLLTHGMFKANMFLGAGSVMHAMDDDVNMRHYGALSRVLPVTFWTFAAGYLAIIGFPGFAGYFSKDHIIEAAFEHNNLVGVLTIIGAGLTAFYMTRLMIMTWFGMKRWRAGVHPHESPWVMTVPLIVLGIGSAIGGLAMNWWIQAWLEPSTGAHPHEVSAWPTPIGWVTLGVVALGIVGAWMMFGRNPVPDTAPSQVSPVTVIGRNDLYGDAINNTLIVSPTRMLADNVVLADDKLVDGAVMTTAEAVGGVGGQLRKMQNGSVRSYALVMVTGVVFVGLVLILGQWV